MGFKNEFYGISMVFPQEFFGNSMGFPWGSLEFLWWFYDMSMGFLLDSCGISKNFSMIFLWDYYWGF